MLSKILLFALATGALAFPSNTTSFAKREHHPVLDKKTHTSCDSPDHGYFDPNLFDKALEVYHSSFGGGAGTLNNGYGGAPTYQGICCDAWCLWVEHEYLPHDYTWTDEQFAGAVAMIREWAPGRGGCHTDIQDKKLYLYYTRDDHKIYMKRGKAIPEGEIPVGREFGNTCMGAKPYIGPA